MAAPGGNFSLAKARIRIGWLGSQNIGVELIRFVEMARPRKRPREMGANPEVVGFKLRRCAKLSRCAVSTAPTF